VLVAKAHTVYGWLCSSKGATMLSWQLTSDTNLTAAPACSRMAPDDMVAANGDTRAAVQLRRAAFDDVAVDPRPCRAGVCESRTASVTSNSHGHNVSISCTLDYIYALYVWHVPLPLKRLQPVR